MSREQVQSRAQASGHRWEGEPGRRPRLPPEARAQTHGHLSGRPLPQTLGVRRLSPELGVKGLLFLPACPGHREAVPCPAGRPEAHLRHEFSPSSVPLPSRALLPPPSGGAKLSGARARGRQGCAVRGFRRGRSLCGQLSPNLLPWRFARGCARLCQGGREGSGRGPWRERVVRAPKPFRVPRPPRSDLRTACWGTGRRAPVGGVTPHPRRGHLSLRLGC